jgi:dolichyl-phosphate-mannose--protein O-mannosyl transferase
MVLLETIFLTQSRFILLDMPMLFFIACSVYAYTQVWRSGWCVGSTMIAVYCVQTAAYCAQCLVCTYTCIFFLYIVFEVAVHSPRHADALLHRVLRVCLHPGMVLVRSAHNATGFVIYVRSLIHAGMA